MNSKAIKNQKIAYIVCLAVIMPVIIIRPVYADGYDVWLTPFENLINTMITFMGIIGKALLAWAIFEVATALFSHDTSQMPQALRRIGAGTLLIFIQTIITAMAGSGAAAPPAPETVAMAVSAIQNTLII